MKKIIGYFDMDGPLADFETGIGRGGNHPDRGIYSNDRTIVQPMYEKGFFRNLPVTEGAREAVTQLLKLDRIDWHIATKPMVDKVFYSATEKFEWIDEHFPELVKNTFLTCDKGHLNGHYLIDDHREAWEPVFQGSFLFFDVRDPKTSWKNIVNYLQKYDPNNLPNQVKEVKPYPALMRTINSVASYNSSLSIQVQVKVDDNYVKLATFDMSNGKPCLTHSSDRFELKILRSFDMDMALAENKQCEWKSFTYYGDIGNLKLDEKVIQLTNLITSKGPMKFESHIGNPR